MPRGARTTDLPTKPCVACGRVITWRKKWERDWASVKYCSDKCRRFKTRPTDGALEAAILDCSPVATRARRSAPARRRVASTRTAGAI
jgi:hypothetical protein